MSSNQSDSQSDDFRLSALAYHRSPKPGKIEIQATKPLGTQHDLALAYTPGVAIACEAIAADPRQAAELTAAWPDPAIYLDPVYWAELKRRNAIQAKSTRPPLDTFREQRPPAYPLPQAGPAC